MVSVIIVNYNGENFLVECLESIQEKCVNMSYEVIMVDNDSTDGSLTLVKENFPWVKLIESNENLGFAKGNNLGVAESQGEYILLLNNDTVLLDGWESLLDCFSDESVGSIGIKMLGGEKEHRKSVGYFPSPYRLFKLALLNVPLSRLENLERSSDLIHKVDWVEGSFILTTRENWDMVNGLDESYFMYAEDVSFCKKMQLKNKYTYYAPLYSYIHYGGYNHSREYLLKTGLSLFVAQFYSGLYLKLCQASIFFNFNVVKALKRKLLN